MHKRLGVSLTTAREYSTASYLAGATLKLVADGLSKIGLEFRSDAANGKGKTARQQSLQCARPLFHHGGTPLHTSQYTHISPQPAI